MTLASLVFTYDGPLTIRVEHRLSGGRGHHPLHCHRAGLGLWLLTCSGPPTEIRPGFYKVTSTHTVTSGGSGSGKETTSLTCSAGSCS